MTTTLYKLTTANQTTYGGFRWQQNRRRVIRPRFRARDLCTDSVLHAYRGADLALLLDDAHARYLRNVGPYSTMPARLWRAETESGVVADDGAKVGVWDLTLREQIPLPTWLYARPIVVRASARLALLALGSLLPLIDDTTDALIARDVYRAGESLLNAEFSQHQRPEQEIDALRLARRAISYDTSNYYRTDDQYLIAAHSAATTLIEFGWGVSSQGGRIIASDVAGTIETCAKASKTFDAAVLAERAVKETLEREKAVVAP